MRSLNGLGVLTYIAGDLMGLFSSIGNVLSSVGGAIGSVLGGPAGGPIGSIAGNVLGGLFGGKSADDANKANLQMAARNEQLQREFAQHGIRWKVEDARAAGIHPLAALGSSTISYQPQSIGFASSPGIDFGQMGQDVSRAVHATRTARERALEIQRVQARQSELDSINLERHRADLAHMGLQNALLASQIQRLQQQSNPPFPGDAGSSPVGAVSIVPAEVTSRDRDIRSLEAGGSTPGFKKFSIGGPGTGGVIELPGQQMSESLESLGPLAAPYVWAHNMSRWFDQKWSGGKPPPSGPGYSWRWNRWNQTWEAVPTR